ncbi:MAG: carboxyl-terminal processing protease [Saprospiraceae bacterium]|jgi:carboxyl-terminal processing protease
MKNNLIKQLSTWCVASLFTALPLTVIAQDNNTAATSSLPLEEIEMFAQVFSKIKSDYVDAVDEKKMLLDAINGMLAGLDPHSAFLDKDSFKELRIDTNGEFGGVGIEVSAEKTGIRVVSPIEDTPADRAGVEAGDLILGIDGKSIVGQNLNEAVEKMRGEVGSAITLTILREGTEKPYDIEIIRDVIQLTSVKTKDLGEPGYAYMRVTQFQASSAQNLKRKIEQFQEAQTINGLILDLRNNPGGVLSGAVDISDLFLEVGADIVATHGRTDDAETAFEAESGDLLEGAPMVVLVNNGSASASEIVAGALQDHGRAIILGTTSFGKGSVQTISQLPSGSGLKLTTARYYTPGGRSIQETGIAPDILSQRSEIIKTEGRKRLREVDLDRHLVNEATPADEDKEAEKTTDDDQAVKDWLAEDSQLREALNLLKGINLANLSGNKKAG